MNILDLHEIGMEKTVQTILSVLDWNASRASENDDPSFSECLSLREKLLQSGNITKNEAEVSARVIRWALHRINQWDTYPFGGFLTGWSVSACEKHLHQIYTLLREQF